MATFEEFAGAVLDHIWSMANAICAKRIDIVAHFYNLVRKKTNMNKKIQGVSLVPKDRI
jgi:hypothetical protein